MTSHQSDTSCVVLIGMRGAGKTVVGRLLAKRLGRPFIDTDDVIEQRGGRTITEIFSAEGEAGFRRREHEVIEQLDPDRPMIISVGGGAVLHPDNRARLRDLGHVVWLDAATDVLWDRMRGDSRTSSTRPPLLSDGGKSELDALLRERAPLYGATAELIVDTTRETPEGVADRIVWWLTESANA